MSSYARLGISLLISYAVMLAIMFSRVNVFSNIFLSLNQFYMTGLMIAPMLIIMILTMGKMYQDKKLNSVLIGTALVAMALFWSLLRTQTGVDDQQFLRSMIPHHAAAILVCEEADLSNPEIVALCGDIIEAQEREIRLMKDLMK